MVYTIELSSRKVAQAIAETTGAQVRTFHSCQTVSRTEFDGGATYISLMTANVAALRGTVLMEQEKAYCWTAGTRRWAMRASRCGST